MKENKNLIEVLIDPGQQKDFREFVTYLTAEADKGSFILKNDIILLYYRFCEHNCREMLDIEKSSIYSFISKIQEIFFRDHYIVVMHRYHFARYRFYNAAGRRLADGRDRPFTLPGPEGTAVSGRVPGRSTFI
jgi:hypothetical protein